MSKFSVLRHFLRSASLNTEKEVMLKFTATVKVALSLWIKTEIGFQGFVETKTVTVVPRSKTMSKTALNNSNSRGEQNLDIILLH